MKRYPESGQDRPAGGLTRRRFVQLASIGVLTIGAVGCSDDDDDDDNTTTPTPNPRAVDPAPETFPQSIASGDPRPDSVILWTRIADDAAAGADVNVTLLVGTDPQLTNVVMEASLLAQATYDHVVKVKVTQLSAYTTYYYQFQYDGGGSVVGRTKTAPNPDADVPVKFGFISCQDYKSRYYNTLALMSTISDMDFVVHLGDYIYETTAGAALAKNERDIVFTNEAEALRLSEDELAARSVGNYRDIYKTYRTDPMLQRLHERFAMISIWDDHEFSNDSWGANGTYFGDAVSELDVERKKNSERVYAEYMPVDFGLDANGNLVSGDEGLYPNTRLYRDFLFGRNLHLVMTDYRTYRPDHLIAEDAFPGTIVADQATLEAVFAAQGIPFAAVRGNFAPYVGIDDPSLAPYKQVLTGVATQQYIDAGLDPAAAQAKAVEKITGNLSTRIANLMIDGYNATNPPQPLPRLSESGLPVGLAVWMLGKQALLAANGLGARNFVVKDTYDLAAGIAYQASGGASENVFGTDQEQWLRQTIEDSTATWRIVGNSCSFATIILDLSAVPGIPPDLAQRFYLNVDHWDGFPNKKQDILSTFNAKPQTLMLAGDIHASFVAHHGADTYELTVTSVSSTTFKGFIRRVAANPPFSQIPTTGYLVESAENLFLSASPVVDPDSGGRQLRYTRTDVNGFAVMEVDADRAVATYYHIDEDRVGERLYDSAALGSYFTEKKLEVRGGTLTEIY